MAHLLAWIFLFLAPGAENFRVFHVDGKEYKTTFSVDEKFIGAYRGKKSGYLLLRRDGSGEYLYDAFGFAPDHCLPGVISFEWGFLVDNDNNIVRFERDYGYSYPVIYKCTGKTTFQGCSADVFVDYILEYANGDLHVSSSDDWVRKHTAVEQ